MKWTNFEIIVVSSLKSLSWNSDRAMVVEGLQHSSIMSALFRTTEEPQVGPLGAAAFIRAAVHPSIHQADPGPKRSGLVNLRSSSLLLPEDQHTLVTPLAAVMVVVSLALCLAMAGHLGGSMVGNPDSLCLRLTIKSGATSSLRPEPANWPLDVDVA